MKIPILAMPLILTALLLCAMACVAADGALLTPTPVGTPTPLPTIQMGCVEAKNAVQVAIDAYHAQKGVWPTSDGQPGDIDWAKLIPGYMAGVPSDDKSCDWRVNSNPLGEVCIAHFC